MSHPNPISRVLLLAAFTLTATAWGASSCSPSGTGATSTSCTQSTGITTTTAGGGVPAQGNVYPSVITVPTNTLSGTVSKVVVKLTGLSHSVGALNLGFLLVSPSGKALLFMGGMGNFSTQGAVNLTFDDVSGVVGTSCDFASTSSGPGLSTGVYKSRVCDNSVPGLLGGFPSNGNWTGCTTNANCPDAPGPAGTSGTLTLTVFTQETSPNGDWRLFMRDIGQSSGGGAVTSWGLDITSSGVASSGTTTSISNINPTTVLRTTPGVSDSTAITVSVTSSGGTVNAGTVTFTDNASPLTCSPAATVTNNAATCNATFSTEGVHNIQASYGGASGFTGSNSAGPAYLIVTDRTSVTGMTTTAGQFCNSGGLSIPAFGTPLVYPSNIYVTTNGTPSGPNAFAGTLTGLTVSMNNFTTTGGLPEVLLVSPSGKAYILMANAFAGVGGSGNIVLSDAGGSFLPMNGGPSSGTFKPTDYNAGTAQDGAFFANRNATALYNPNPAPTTGYFFPGGSGIGFATFQTTYAGDSPNGTWRLYAINSADGNAGSSNNWCMNLAVNPSAVSTTTTISANPVQVFTTAPTQATTLTATVTSSSTVGLGSVTFSDKGVNLTCTNGAQPIPVSSGVATCSVASFATQGNHNITAVYNPAGSFGNSSGVGVVRVDARAIKTQQSATGYIYCNPDTVTFPGLSNQAGTSSPYPVNIFVPDLPGTINSASVVYKNFHVNTGAAAHDFTSMLVGPNGGNASSFDLMSRVGGIAENFTANVTLADSGASAVPGSAISTGTYKPTSLGGANTYPALIPAGPYPPPAGPFNYAATNGSSTFASIFGAGGSNTAVGNGTWSIYSQTVGNGTTGTIDQACVQFVVNPPVLGITKTHTGNFRAGSTGNTYTVHVTNSGPGPTGGTTTVVDDTTSATGLTVTGMSGTNWSCTVGTKTCTSTDIIGAGNAFPDITVTVSVASNATSPQSNKANVSGGGSTAGVVATDATTILPLPVYSVVKSHSGTFTQGSTGTWNITVSNTAAAAGTTFGSATTVADTLPTGYTLASYSGTNWTCTGTGTANVNCSNPSVIAGGASFATLALVVNIPANSATSVSNSATASGGGVSSSATSNTDTVTVVQVPASISINGTATQSATILTAFTSLAVTVKDANNVVIPSYSSVTFTASTGGNGQSGTFSNSTNTISIATAAGTGIANPGTFTANNKTGAYTVTVTAGSAPSATFNLTNNPGGAATMTAVAGTTPQSAIINTLFTNAPSVAVKDAGNNPVSGVNVTFTAPASGASGLFGNSTVTITVATNASGIASAPFTANGTAGGPYNVTGASSGLTTVNFSLTNTAGAAASMTANASTTPQSTAVSTAFTHPLGVTVKDASNNPVSGVIVTFTAPGSGASGTFGNSTATIAVPTNVSGIASATFTANSTAGGPYNATAAVSGVTTVNFSLTNTAGAASTMTANAGTTPQSAAISTAFTNALAVTIKDAGNNPVSGVNVTFTAPGSGASGTFSNSTATIIVATNASGIASAPFTANGTAGGPYNVTAASLGLTTVNFSLTNTAGAAATVTANAGTSPQTTAINTVFANALSVTVKDAGNNPTSGVTVTFTAPGSGASGKFSNNTATIAVVTNASGIASAPITANATVGGPYTATATVIGLPVVNFSLTNTAGAASTMTANAGTTPQSATISTAFTNALAVTIKDAGNNPVSGVNVTFTAPGSGASGLFSNSTATITVATNASGIASAPFTANATTGGPYNVTAASSGLTTVNFSLTNTAGAASTMTANAGTTPQSAIINTAFATALSVTVKDAGNNPVSGVNVTFTAPNSGTSGLFSNSTVTITVATNASGIASAPFTANGTAGGPYNVTAASAGLTTVNFSLTNSAAAASSMTANAGTTPQSATINTAFTNALAVTVKDTGNNPISGVNVTFTAPGSGASGKFSNNTVTITVATNASGIASAPITANATSGGPYNVTAAASGLTTVNFSLTNTTGAASTMTANAGTTPQSATVSTAFTNALSVTVKDAGNNPVSGVNVTFTAPGSGASGIFSNSTVTITVATNASGIASAPITANATVGGPYNVTAAASGLTTVNFSLTNTTGAASTMTANAGTTPQSATVSTAFTNALSVTVKDAGNNPVSGVNVTFTAPGSGASGLFSNSTATITVATNASGIASAPITANTTVGGPYNVTAAASGLTTVNFSLTNTAVPVGSMTANAGTTPQSTSINTAFTNALAVTVKDSLSNPVSGVNVTFTAPGSGASGLFSNSTTTITVATNASGIASAPFTANTTVGGPYTVTAATAGLPNVNFSLTNTAGAAGSMTANAGTTPQTAALNATFANALAVTVKDSLNNPVSGVNVTFTAPGSGASGLFSNSTTTITVATNASGIASAPFTANGTSGAYNVVASASGLTNVNFSLNNGLTVVAFRVLFGPSLTPLNYDLVGSLRNRVPWQITGIQVVFSAPVTGGDVNSLSGVGLTTTGFSGLGTNTLTWTINPVSIGQFNAALAGSGIDALTSNVGALGNGTGSSQLLRVLYGDYNDDGVVNASDQTLVLNLVRASTYNLFGDMNGDGVVNNTDVQIVRNQIGTTLP